LIATLLLALVLPLAAEPPTSAPASAPASAPHAAPGAPTPEILIEALVATVNQEVITLGEVEAEARIVLVRRGGLVGAQRTVDDGLRSAVLQYLINQEVILAEARRLQLFQVSDDEITREVERVANLFVGEEAYRSFLLQSGLSESDIADIVRRDLRVSKFLRSRIRMVSRLAPQEMRVYYAEHPEEFGALSYDEARPVIEERLGRAQNEDAIREWVSDLKARAEIRVLRSFKPAEASP